MSQSTHPFVSGRMFFVGKVFHWQVSREGKPKETKGQDELKEEK